jgi:hypothetical protein
MNPAATSGKASLPEYLYADFTEKTDCADQMTFVPVANGRESRALL